MLADAIESLTAAGLVKADDTRMLAEFVWAVVHGIAMLAVNGQLGADALEPDALAERVHSALKLIRTGIDRVPAGTPA